MMLLNKLKGLMREHGHTQKYIANYLGLSEYGFNKKLNGKSEFKANELLELSKLYNVSVDYFFTDNVSKQQQK